MLSKIFVILVLSDSFKVLKHIWQRPIIYIVGGWGGPCTPSESWYTFGTHSLVCSLHHALTGPNKRVNLHAGIARALKCRRLCEFESHLGHQLLHLTYCFFSAIIDPNRIGYDFGYIYYLGCELQFSLAPARDTVLYCVLTRLARARVRLDQFV